MKLQENTLFAGRYSLRHILGKGGFSEVWLADDLPTGLLIAIKACVESSADEAAKRAKAFAAEYALTFSLRHENLLLPIFFEVYQDIPCLIMPYCEGGSAGRLVGKLSEQEAWKMMRDVASALDYLHSLEPPLVHCDVKPGNILAGPGGSYLLADFGICRKMNPLTSATEAPERSVGTPAYMSPERFVRGAAPAKASDIFSLGASMYELLTGSAPFGDKGGIQLHKGADLLLIEGDRSPALKDLIMRCLSKDACSRPSAAEIKSAAIAELADKPPAPTNKLRLHLPPILARLNNYQLMLAAWAILAIACLSIIACIALLSSR
ncbi:MAG: serine/threonine protein kinase [Tannerellaceae bacterium]|jgi:serine/threonine protein kinase|nr:serine/threonine protein kinase [Tannerellaceae bacterium]